MNDYCGCCPACAARSAATNLPGLDALSFRRGAYGPTLLAMRDRLSSAELPGLRGLISRAPADPAVALLDGWACVSEVLSFYNERLINEAYLRTCTERRSAVELARLVGYSPRPGVAADVYLAFTLDDINKEARLEVPAGTRAYSQPGPGETMQPFETVEPLHGRPRWTVMRPRMRQPQRIGAATAGLYLKGTATGLRPGDALLIQFPDDKSQLLRKVATITLLPADPSAAAIDPLGASGGRTHVTFQPLPVGATAAPRKVDRSLMRSLLRPPARTTQLPGTQRLDPRKLYQAGSYAPLEALAVGYPALRDKLAAALAGSAQQGETGKVTVSAMRVKAAPHGHNAPLRPKFAEEEDRHPGTILGYEEWKLDEIPPAPQERGGVTPSLALRDDSDPSDPTMLPLDAVYDQIVVGSAVVIEIPGTDQERWPFVKVTAVDTVVRRSYGLPARVTQLTLSGRWRSADRVSLLDVRSITVYAQPERLELADAPLTEPVAGAEIDLDGFYAGLEPGRRLILTGERADLEGIAGLWGTELVMIAAVAHRVVTPPAAPPAAPSRTRRRSRSTPAEEMATGDVYHTYLTLEQPLEHTYHRATVTIYGNVAHATHGESMSDLLGSGNAARPLQSFALRKPPLTYVSAATTTGISSTLKVWVNDLRWYEAPNAAAITADERRFVVQPDEEGGARLFFGLGARLPSGRDNVRASYRAGIGVEGNVKAGQISVLGSRPNGVTGVGNPLPSTGGASRDTLDQIKRRAPVGLFALDRLVSAEDYADFARNFAGIGKARARYFPDLPGGPLLHLTIAGVDDAPLTAASDVYRNLLRALQMQGDPAVPVQIAFRAARLLAIRARIRIHPDYRWEVVRPLVAAALYRTFAFEARALAQPAYASEAIQSMQRVPGVTYIDLDVFGSLSLGTPGQPPGPTGGGADAEPMAPEEIGAQAEQLFSSPATTDADYARMAIVEARAAARAGPGIHAAELVYLSPRLPATLLLELIEEEVL
jgi:predicted phage baseplate assembly protein